MNEQQPTPYGVVDFDFEDSNPTRGPHFSDILAVNLRRRGFLGGALGAAVGAALLGKTGESVARSLENIEREAQFLDGVAKSGIPVPLPTRPAFAAVASTRQTSVAVPPGYTARITFKWGEPITGSYPAYRPDGSNTGAEQEQQIGQHHDGMQFFALPGFDPNRRGLFAINHEYIEQAYLLRDGAVLTGNRPADDVRKEIAAHGVSVFEAERQADGNWSIVRGPYNRRITAGTTIEISGPARGNAKLVTSFSPDGTRTRGTINNCANGYTPWGTYLTCEENFAGYYVNRDTTRPREQTRYGVPSTATRYNWETVEPRFDVGIKATTAAGDFRNESNGQGWVVEIDPYDPNSVPRKRTAMGRFGHEGCVFAPPRVGRPYVFYMGDDANNEYIYKFVTNRVYVPLVVDRDALDSGTLFVGKFNDDGTGEWLPLDLADATFRARATAAGVVFADQGDVVINARAAADVVGATRMDRPEWGAVDPRDGQVYFTLTNNSSRTAAQATPANPRGPNPFGHIIRWREANDDSAARTFRWDLLLLSGTETDSANFAAGSGAKLTADSIHASPDGLWFDPAGTLWIQSDMSGSQQATGPFGENQMLAMDVRTGVIRRFFAGPPGQEVTGITSTPDLRTLFINLQHPNEGGLGIATPFPDGPGTRPRACTVVITKNDGGLIGT